MNVFAVVFGCLLIAVSLAVSFAEVREHDPKDLSYWMRIGTNKDWSKEAAHGEPQAQFHFGMSLVRSNFVTMVDRVPGLSAVPLYGKRFFEKTSYDIASSIDQRQLEDPYRWIRKSADQGFASAKEAEKLFMGKVAKPNNGDAANGNQPIRSVTNSTTLAAVSRR